ncbi:MAG: Type 1 glutamine amidotransferase-like domain-containing protein [Tyzzerella sp.]|nr:Type 1 glutamine amidotransferase-like domain-containing protein [Tyzzerella sp.]
MVVFLTSSPCDDAPEGADVPFILKEENEFVQNLKKHYVAGSNCLMISANPEAYERNDRMANEFREGFAYHGMVFEEMWICDWRNAEQVEEMIDSSNMIILAGGHVPTQNAFFREIGLREKLQDYDGAVMGISAGTMNCADVVYAQPEEEGESIDPDYQRYLRGLGFTDINVLPHYQMVKDYMLDGRRLYEDITFEDSYGQRFYVLVDGSYIIVEDGRNVLYGETYLIQDGVMEKICSFGEKISI